MYIQKVYTELMSKGRKTPISLRIDEHVLSWFKSQRPTGYQSLMHSVLDEFMKRRTEQSLHAAGRAQEIFRRYYAQCFWHYDKDLKIGLNNMQIVVEGLRMYGGREGLILAEELCQ